MKQRSRFATLRQYVDAQLRTKSQGEVAGDLGLAQNTLSQYLSGQRIPRRDVALRLARELGIPLENLLNPPDAQREATR